MAVRCILKYFISVEKKVVIEKPNSVEATRIRILILPVSVCMNWANYITIWCPPCFLFKMFCLTLKTTLIKWD